MNERKIFRRIVIASILAVFLSVGMYLWMSWQTLGLGFPLDDAWIHQTYARNLVQGGEWAFLPGQPSVGSTSPLWTALMAIGHSLELDPRLWSYAVGAVCLVFTAMLGSRWLIRRMDSDGSWSWVVAALLAFEWHLAWAAVSGMEILALGLMVILVLYMLESDSWSSLAVGSVIGLGVWLRPEALLLALAAIWVILFKDHFRIAGFLKRAAGLALGMGILIVPYLLFNRAISGEWWPTTFYAKQAEYAVMRETSLLIRVAQQFSIPFVGMLILLLPGIVLGAVNGIRRRTWTKLAPLVWVCGHLGAYAWRLPKVYQHGRYAMPVVPVLLVLGMEGMLDWIELRADQPVRRLLSRAWLLSVLAATAGFWYLGAQSYGQDVAIIESEMVACSRWISENTEADAIVAAHDIGALGYFGDREVLDLAGLVDADVIPIIRDETALAEWLDARHADYLMTFPGWYPQLTSDAEQIFTTDAPFGPAAGSENMAVYIWR
jgi:hypothetical protein